MTLATCSHGEPMGQGCYRCHQMAESIRGEAGDERPPAPTHEEAELRRSSRWPEFIRRLGARR